jgi:terpene synthase-like protein
MEEHHHTRRLQGNSEPGDALPAATPPARWALAELGLFAAPYRRHPQARLYLELTRADVVRRGVVCGEDVRRFERFSVLDALMYAEASFARLVVCGGFNQWLFFLDDQYDNHPEVATSAERMHEVVSSAFDALASGRLPRTTSPFAELSATVGRRIRARASARLWDRFLRDTHAYLFHGSSVAASHYTTVLPPETYRPLRRLDSSMSAVVDVVELSHEGVLSEDDIQQPHVSELRQLACDHVAFLNDLVSYHREVVRAGCSFNLLHALCVHACEGSLQRAIASLIQELNGIAFRFEALAANAHGPVARHAQALRCMMAANHRFSFQSGRYHHPDAHLAELRGTPLDAPGSSVDAFPPDQ